MTQEIGLGDRVKDKISGTVGICVAITQWLYGCKRINIQPEGLTKDKKPCEQISIDEPQAVLIKEAAIDRRRVPTHGPTPAPQRQKDVTR